MVSKMQISLDDVKGIFKFLAGNSEVKSIFETNTLGFLRELHQSYGSEFSLLCMYKTPSFSLEQVSDCYKAEFLDNQDWLHFGFHAWDENSDYREATGEQIAEDYQITMSQISRITGITQFSDTIRLHKFAGSREACRVLKEKGIRCLLSADDERDSYYLSKREMAYVNNEGAYFDKSEGILFCRSLTRLEKSENPISDIQKCFDKGVQIISVFTHEWQMDKREVRAKLQECCEWEWQMRRKVS